MNKFLIVFSLLLIGCTTPMKNSEIIEQIKLCTESGFAFRRITDIKNFTVGIECGKASKQTCLKDCTEVFRVSSNGRSAETMIKCIKQCEEIKFKKNDKNNSTDSI